MGITDSGIRSQGSGPITSLLDNTARDAFCVITRSRCWCLHAEKKCARVRHLGWGSDDG